MASEERHKTQPVAKSEDHARLGALFRESREKADMTLQQLSQRMGVSINTIRWHEAGDTMLRAHDLARAAELMNVSAGYLLGDPVRPRRTRREVVDG